MSALRAIVNGRVILPDRVLNDTTVLFGRTILGLFGAKDELPEGCEILDAEGGFVSPGFVDIHVHGGGGADFLDATREAIRRALFLHASHGTTSLLPTTLTCPEEVLLRGLRAISSYRGEGGAEILGLHLEGPYFSSGSKGAQAIRDQKIPTLEELEEIDRAAGGRILRFDAAPELPNMDLFAEWTKKKGILASIGHSEANAETAIEFFGKGFTHVTHLYCSTTTEHKEGQTVHGGIVEAAYLIDGFTVELIGDGKHVPRETMLLCFKIKGADRVALVTDAMRAAGTNVTESVLGEKETGTRVIVENGVAKLPDRSFFAGSVATMDRCLRTAVGYGVPLCDAVKSCSLTPARIVGADGRKGSIEVGKDADLLILGDDLSVKDVFLKGEKLTREAAQ